MTVEKKKAVVSIRLPESLRRILRGLAKRDKRRLSDWLRSRLEADPVVAAALLDAMAGKHRKSYPLRIEQ